ncbi:MAG: VOC family protein [Gemmatimonadales bacterium]
MIRSIKFIGIPVADQDRALAFYTGLLGCVVRTDVPHGTQRWIELQCTRGETGIALFTPPGQEDRVGTFVNASFEVEDVFKMFAELGPRGVEFVQEPQKTSWGSSAIIKDSEGNQLVLSSR